MHNLCETVSLIKISSYSANIVKLYMKYEMLYIWRSTMHQSWQNQVFSETKLHRNKLHFLSVTKRDIICKFDINTISLQYQMRNTSFPIILKQKIGCNIFMYLEMDISPVDYSDDNQYFSVKPIYTDHSSQNGHHSNQENNQAQEPLGKYAFGTHNTHLPPLP